MIGNAISNVFVNPQAPSEDEDFNVAGDEIFATFSPWASWLSVGNPFAPAPAAGLRTVADGSAGGQGNPDSTVAVTSGGITINLIFDTAAMAAPASFRAGIQQAVSILAAAISDKITVNIKIDYSGTGGGASAGPDHGLLESYSAIRTDLINNATPGDTSFNALPAGSSIQGQTNVAVWNAQLKLWGLMAPNDTTTDDGGATFATDINPNLLVGVALHELTHAMGRVPYGPQPDIFDFFRFTGVGTQLFKAGATAPAAYFSLDGGTTKLADYGRTSDASDFLNSGVQGSSDPFNEFYNGSTAQHLTAVDLKQLDALGFHLTTPDTHAPLLLVDSALSIEAGATQAITSSQLTAADDISSTAQLHYNVTTGPADGTLLLSGLATSSFTQADINNGLVSYHETAIGVSSDAFSFQLSDAAGNTSGISSLQININPAPVPQAFTSGGIWTPAGNGIDNTWHVGDFNGDGKDDIFRYLGGEDVFLSTGTSFAHSGLWSPAGNGSDNQWHVGDFNGDGKDDIFRYLGGTASTDMFLSNGSSFVYNGSWTPASTGSDGTWHVGDFNGDGKADIFRYSGGEDVFLSNGSSFGNESLWSPAGNGSDGKWYVGDFNGDGKDDIFRFLAGTGNQVFLSNGSSFVYSGVWTPASTGSDGTWHLGDFNGDGKTDIFRTLAGQSGADVFLSNGSSFVHDASWTAASVGSDNQWYVGDFNGGGADDIFRQLSGVDMLLSHFG
jgi:Cadherin-like/FG-GAP-like repeat